MANLHPWPKRGLVIDFMHHLNAGPEAVWHALTTESELQRWLRVSTVELPLLEGADFVLAYETQGRSSGGNSRVISGYVHKLITGRLLALEMVLPFSEATTYLSFQIQPSFALFGEDRSQECDLWLIHSDFPDDGMGLFEFDGCSRHWRQAVGELAAMLEHRPGKPTPYALAGLQFVGGAPGIGLMVSDTIAGSPAETAGIKSGDVIRAVDGHQLEALDDFHDWIDERRPGETGRFQLQDREVEVTVESVEDARNRFLMKRGEDWVPVR